VHLAVAIRECGHGFLSAGAGVVVAAGAGAVAGAAVGGGAGGGGTSGPLMPHPVAANRAASNAVQVRN